MEIPADAETLRRCIGAVSRSAPGYATNLYAAPDQIDRWRADGRLGVVTVEGAVLLLHRDRDFHRVFHVAESRSALRAALERLPDGTWVSDVIGREDAPAGSAAAYADAGFVPHMLLRRMIRTQVPAWPADGSGDAEVASPAEASAVAAFLDRLLDRFGEQVPDATELTAEAEAGQLLLVRRDDGELAGMLLYTLQGRTAHLRFWHVDVGARGQGVGRRLMAAFLARCAGAGRLVLWVIGDNERSISIYRHYGFDTDCLVDRIVILRKGASQ